MFFMMACKVSHRDVANNFAPGLLVELVESEPNSPDTPNKKPAMRRVVLFGAPGEITDHIPVICPSGHQHKTLMFKFAPSKFSRTVESEPNSPDTPNKKPAMRRVVLFGAPGEIRTPDRSVRSRVLYPAELQAQIFS